MEQSIGARKTEVIPVGGEFHLRLGKDRIMYAGMPSEEVYSIAERKSTGYQGYAWNLFFPKRKRDITIDGINLYVEKVTPEEIEIRVA